MALSVVAMGASALGFSALTGSAHVSETPRKLEKRAQKMSKMPTLFVPHGGGPWPFVDLGDMSSQMDSLREYLVGIPSQLPSQPRAVLVVSAHWEEAVPTVQASSKPQMLYDYGGFPPEAYEIQWPAPGCPPIARRTRELLSDSGILSAENTTRGFDHGAFVVTKLMYPHANIPTFQLSLTRDLDPKRLWAIGKALNPLRDEGVLILGSGYSYHNMRGFFSTLRGAKEPGDDALIFDDWLTASLLLEPSERQSQLFAWETAPRARACHPREEHLMPLFVCAGAAEDDVVTTPFHQSLMGLKTLSAQFG